MKHKTRYQIYAILVILALCAICAVIAFANPSLVKSLSYKGIGFLFIVVFSGIWMAFAQRGENKDKDNPNSPK